MEYGNYKSLKVQKTIQMKKKKLKFTFSLFSLYFFLLAHTFFQKDLCNEFFFYVIFYAFHSDKLKICITH